MTESRRHFAGRVNRALDDAQLQQAMTQAMTGLRARRNAAFESFDFDKGRQELKPRRQANLERAMGGSLASIPAVQRQTDSPVGR